MREFEQEEHDLIHDQLIDADLQNSMFQFYYPREQRKQEAELAVQKENEVQAYLATIQKRPDGQLVVVLPKEPVYKELITNNEWSAEKRLQSGIRSMERSTEMQ